MRATGFLLNNEDGMLRRRVVHLTCVVLSFGVVGFWAWWLPGTVRPVPNALSLTMGSGLPACQLVITIFPEGHWPPVSWLRGYARKGETFTPVRCVPPGHSLAARDDEMLTALFNAFPACLREQLSPTSLGESRGWYCVRLAD
jgi:hypothetical protein